MSVNNTRRSNVALSKITPTEYAVAYANPDDTPLAEGHPSLGLYTTVETYGLVFANRPTSVYIGVGGDLKVGYLTKKGWSAVTYKNLQGGCQYSISPYRIYANPDSTCGDILLEF